MKSLTDEWVRKAEKDFLVAGRELMAQPPEYDSVCFHSQQCVEKYFKAILQEKEILFEKTHDLDLLLEKSKSLLPELALLKVELVELSSFAVDVRYPGVEATAEEANKCFSTAQQTRQIARKFFGLPDSV